MAAENNLWTTMRPRFLEAGFFAQRIETSTSEGVPDLWVGIPNERYVWLELKAIRAWPARATTRVFGDSGLRPEQVNWHVGAAAKRVCAFIFCGVGVGCRRQTFLLPATVATTFNSMTKPELLPYECTIPQLIERLRK